MISLCQIDAAVRRVRYYNPDLELELLFLDEAELQPENAGQIAQIRGALVARVADIVKQASNQTQALDAAVATIQLLISSYNGIGNRPGPGHKPALQAIRLLASVSKRFDAAIDLFFDLVERFCAQSRGQGASYSDAFALRMMQNYDQTLVKLISRQWSKARKATQWNIEKPLQRIKTLRRIYDFQDNMSIRSVRTFRKRQPSSTLFSESYQVLKTIQNKSNEMLLASWVRSIAAQFRWSKKEQAFDPTASSLSTASTFSELDPASPVSAETRRKFKPRDAEVVDLKNQVDMLCAVIEKNAHANVYNTNTSDFETASSYTFADDTISLRSHRTGQTKLFHAT